MIIINFGGYNGNLRVRSVQNRMKFILVKVMGTYALSIDWVDF